MLSAKEIKSLKPGEYPNHVLRMKFGVKHGSVIKVAYLDEQKQIKETEFVGNRQQKEYFRKNPKALIGDFRRTKDKPTYQSSRFNVKKEASAFGKVLDFIKSMFGFLNFSKA